MALTDREIIKQRLTGVAQSYGLAADPKAATAAIHTRSRDFAKVGTENAATNVAETLMFPVNRKSIPASIKFTTGTAVASDNTDYVVLTISKRTGTGAAVTVASWNSHGGAQGAITANVPASLSIVPNADSVIAAGDILTYSLGKVGAGKAVGIGTITPDLEEV